MNWAQFTGIRNGTRVFNHGFDQCVAVANLYHESVIGGSFVPVASAYQWWTNFNSYGTLTANYTRSSTPVAGAIFVARYGIYNAPHGHIGVVTSVNANGTFNTMEQNAERHRYVYRYARGMANILGFLIPKSNPAVSTKGQKVRHYQRQDRDARARGRTLKPGQNLYLNTNSGGLSNAANVVGSVGYYSITPHIYAEGTPGDTLDLKLVWQDVRTKPQPRQSAHYVETLVFDRHGRIKASREFKRYVSAGFAVYVAVTAPKSNKGNVKVSLLDSDAYLFI